MINIILTLINFQIIHPLIYLISNMFLKKKIIDQNCLHQLKHKFLIQF